MKTDSLQDLFINELGDLYSAGSQVLKVLPKMAEAAIAPELRQLFQSQIIQARAQVERIETVAKTLGIEAISKRCRGMEGLVEETEEMIAERAASHARDAGLSLKALRMQHYLRAAGMARRAPTRCSRWKPQTRANKLRVKMRCGLT